MPKLTADSVERRASSIQGFTLVEILVVMAMVGVVMGALLTSFLIGRKSYLSADAYIQVQQEARRAFDVIVKELREARVDGPDGDAFTNQPFTDVTRVNLQVAEGYDVPASGCGTAICWGDGTATNDGRWIHYLPLVASPTNTQLIRCVSAGADDVIGSLGDCNAGTVRVLANNVQTFLASYVDAPDKTVTIQLAIQQVSQQLAGGSMSTTPAPLRTRVRLRN